MTSVSGVAPHVLFVDYVAICEQIESALIDGSRLTACSLLLIDASCWTMQVIINTTFQPSNLSIIHKFVLCVLICDVYLESAMC